MKNLTDKILLFIITFILVTSCRKQCKYNSDTFLNKIEIFNRVRKSLKNESITKEWNKEELSKIISYNDFLILDELDFQSINKIENVYVFTFKSEYDSDWFDKKFNTNMKSCNTYIFFSTDVDLKEKIINYPQYSECMYERKDIDLNWTYVFQKWYCSD